MHIHRLHIYRRYEPPTSMGGPGWSGFSDSDRGARERSARGCTCICNTGVRGCGLRNAHVIGYGLGGQVLGSINIDIPRACDYKMAVANDVERFDMWNPQTHAPRPSTRFERMDYLINPHPSALLPLYPAIPQSRPHVCHLVHACTYVRTTYTGRNRK